jgi:hypothetical protein
LIRIIVKLANLQLNKAIYLIIHHMEILNIQLSDQKAYKFLEGMEELNLIKILKEQSNISSLLGKIKTRTSNEELINN